MRFSTLYKMLVYTSLIVASSIPVFSYADGGIVLGGTRVIYPAGQKESSITVRNTSDSSRFMVQSWVEDQSEKKTTDFIVTPPLYVSNPGSENTLRLMYVGGGRTSDHESLYYLKSKAIPAIDKNRTAGKNILMLSATTRIKLFIRPAGLKPSRSEAPSRLTFSRSGNTVTVKNPTPYYITLTRIMISGMDMKKTVMVPPFGIDSLALPSAQGGRLSFRTINDFGGFSDEQVKDI